MRKCVMCATLSVGLVVGCKSGEAPVQEAQQQPVQPTAPVRAAASEEPTLTQVAQVSSPAAKEMQGTFGWKPYDQESFTTGPSQGRVFDVPLHATKLQVRVNASQPVFAGVMTREQLSTRKGAVRAGNFLSLPCGIVGRAGGERTCGLDPLSAEEFVLRDVREQQMMVDPRMKQGANRISVTLSVWACVEHCKAVEAAH